MTINEHLTEFFGRPVRDFQPDAPLEDPARNVYRVAFNYEDETPWEDQFQAYLKDPLSGQTVGLVVGGWREAMEGGGSAKVVQALVDARARLPKLQAIFLGDMTYEECEISWINQSHMEPLFQAYPALVEFGVRGATELSLGHIHAPQLRSLRIESGGLPAGIVGEVFAADVPALEHLELWLGTDEYGGDTTLEDLRPLLEGRVFPRLKYLGLRDSQIADELAKALATAPIVGRLEVLDLSLGTLSDEGAAALLASPAVRKLKKLDIHHHYLSEEMVQKLTGLGPQVDASDEQGPASADDRYVAVSE